MPYIGWGMLAVLWVVIMAVIVNEDREKLGPILLIHLLLCYVGLAILFMVGFN